MGFVVEPDEAKAWIAENPHNTEVLFPYLNGEDLNSRPDCSASRWVIDFNDWPESKAKEFHLPYRRLHEEAKPERAKASAEVAAAPWWLFWRARPALRKALADLNEALVIARVSKSVMPLRVPTGQVFHEKLVVFASDSVALQAVLSSSAHQLWAIQYGTTMRVDPTYTPERCFESFVLPEFTGRLEECGHLLDIERRAIMQRRDLGLTSLYNLVNNPQIADRSDPDVARMRAIHVALDEAVMGAYGWSDIALDHGFHTYRQMERWTVSPAARVEILDRLLEANHRRTAQEAAAGQPKRKGRRATDGSEGEETLFS